MKDFHLLRTDYESDKPLQIVAEGAEITPYCFKYIMPYDTFPNLRRSYECQIGYIPFGPEKRCVTIDLTEWIGHESEEYLDIFLKYLADHNPRYISRWILYVRTMDSTGGEKLFDKVMEELGTVEVENIFRNEEIQDEDDKRIRG